MATPQWPRGADCDQLLAFMVQTLRSDPDLSRLRPEKRQPQESLSGFPVILQGPRALPSQASL